MRANALAPRHPSGRMREVTFGTVSAPSRVGNLWLGPTIQLAPLHSRLGSRLIPPCPPLTVQATDALASQS